MEAAPGPLDFNCPRCGAATATKAAFYGPCANCRDDLNAKYPGDKRQVEVEDYVPRSHVQVNNVAGAAEKD